MILSSPAFKEGERVPVKYTCDGQNISPPLAWGEVPEGAKSFTLIVDDPDAPTGTFTHWVLFNLHADSRELTENISPQGKLPNGALQGKNDFGKIGYGGPCPPPGPSHHYHFKIYALDQNPDLKSGTSKEQVLQAMEGHVLAQGELIGLYGRKK